MTAKRGGRPAADRRKASELSDMVDEASRESFPASDPPPWTSGRENRRLPANGKAADRKAADRKAADRKAADRKAKRKAAAPFDAAAPVRSSKRD